MRHALTCYGDILLAFAVLAHFLKLVRPCCSFSARIQDGPQSLVENYLKQRTVLADDTPIILRTGGDDTQYKHQALTRSLILVPTKYWSENVSYQQMATNTMLKGAEEITYACVKFDKDFQSNGAINGALDGVACRIGRVSTVEENIVKVQWNVTWIPPTSLWLRGLGDTLGWIPELTTYNHLSREVSVFRWGAIRQLFQTAIATGKLKVPLACIEGQTSLTFEKEGEGGRLGREDWKLTKIKENLSYADDLVRGALQNRRCATDLKLFLESGRCPPGTPGREWEDTVKVCLPWERVPGMGVMDLEPMADEEKDSPVIFLLSAAVIVVTFANAIAANILY
jgi:hypothetical protein